MTKFTPGTWAFEPMEVPRPFGRECSVRIFSHDPGPSFDFHIGLVVDVDRETREANARLIAVAPEMYSLIEDLRDELDNRYDGADDSRTRWMGEWIDKADTLVRKAGGTL
jgi:hypothetical protein